MNYYILNMVAGKPQVRFSLYVLSFLLSNDDSGEAWTSTTDMVQAQYLLVSGNFLLS